MSEQSDDGMGPFNIEEAYAITLSGVWVQIHMMVFFFQAEDGIRGRLSLVGSEMCIRDRKNTPH